MLNMFALGQAIQQGKSIGHELCRASRAFTRCGRFHADAIELEAFSRLTWLLLNIIRLSFRLLNRQTISRNCFYRKYVHTED